MEDGINIGQTDDGNQKQRSPADLVAQHPSNDGDDEVEYIEDTILQCFVSPATKTKKVRVTHNQELCRGVCNCQMSVQPWSWPI